PDQQPEHSREGEIGERKEHSAILPSVALGEPARSPVSGRYRLRSPARSGIRARARETGIAGATTTRRSPRGATAKADSPNRHFETPHGRALFDPAGALRRTPA